MTCRGWWLIICLMLRALSVVIFPAALYVLNHRRLAPALPVWARPGRGMGWLLGIAFLAYLLLAVAYLYLTLRR